MIAVAKWRTFRDVQEKAAFMQEGARHDARTPLVIATASRFRSIADPRERTRAILLFCQYCIEYVRDPGPGVEVLDSAEVGLVRGFGDCDLKARLCVALMLATGLHAEIDPVFVDDTFPHVRAKVYLNERWWLVDPSILNSDIGQIPKRGIVTNWREE
jgi:transglutaminase-like putative cysteine protease